MEDRPTQQQTDDCPPDPVPPPVPPTPPPPPTSDIDPDTAWIIARRKRLAEESDKHARGDYRGD